MKRVFCILLILPCLATSTACADVDPVATISLSNQYRVAHHVRPLANNKRLQVAAQMKADELAQGAPFSHKGVAGALSIQFIMHAGYPAYMWGENLARLYVADATSTVAA